MTIRLLAVDYGLARVGLALSDPLGITAQPLVSLQRRSDRQICREIAQIAKEKGVTEVIVGLPLELSGNHGDAAQAVTKFVAALERFVDVPISTWDERLTTSEAERSLRESGLNWKKRRKVVDQVAACLILRGALDARHTTQAFDSDYGPNYDPSYGTNHDLTYRTNYDPNYDPDDGSSDDEL